MLRTQSGMSPGLPLALLLVLALCGGCDFFVLTQEGLVKKRCKEWANAVSRGDWKAVTSHYDRSFVWQRQGGSKRKGADGAAGFKATIFAVPNRDDFFINVVRVKKIDEKHMVAIVRCQIHTIEDSQQLEYSNIVWDGKMWWVKRGTGVWKMTGFKETSRREKGQHKRAGV